MPEPIETSNCRDRFRINRPRSQPIQRARDRSPQLVMPNRQLSLLLRMNDQAKNKQKRIHNLADAPACALCACPGLAIQTLSSSMTSMRGSKRNAGSAGSRSRRDNVFNFILRCLNQFGQVVSREQVRRRVIVAQQQLSQIRLMRLGRSVLNTHLRRSHPHIR